MAKVLTGSRTEGSASEAEAAVDAATAWYQLCRSNVRTVPSRDPVTR